MATPSTLCGTDVYPKYNNIKDHGILRTLITEYFNEPDNTLPEIGSWCVEEVEDFSNLFRFTKIANETLNWNVGKAVTMTGMFSQAEFFIGNGLENWDTSNVYSMAHMFADAKNFRGNLTTWKVGNVTDFSYMFHNAESFNHTHAGYVGDWDVSKGTIFQGMFKSASTFNDPELVKWIPKSAIDLSHMFEGATAFNVNLESWKDHITNVISMAGMFNEAESLDVDLSSWDISDVEDLSTMFRRTNLSASRNYCAWADQVDVTTTEVGRMFFGTNCNSTEDIQYCKDDGAMNRSIGPFCAECRLLADGFQNCSDRAVHFASAATPGFLRWGGGGGGFDSSSSLPLLMGSLMAYFFLA